MDSPWPRSFSPLFIPHGPTVANPNKQQAQRVSAYPHRIRPYSPTTIGLPTDLAYLAEDERDPEPVGNNPPNGRKLSRPKRHTKPKMQKTSHHESLVKTEATAHSYTEAQQSSIPGWAESAPRETENEVEQSIYFLPTPPYSIRPSRINTPSGWRSYQASLGSAWDSKSVDLQSGPTPPRTPSFVMLPTGTGSVDDEAVEADHETMDGDLCESLHRVNEQMRILRKTRTDSRQQVNRLKTQYSAVNARLQLVTSENAQLHREAAYERDQRALFEHVVHNLNSMVEQAQDDIANALREIEALEDEVTRLKKRPCEFDDEEDRSRKRGRLF